MFLAGDEFADTRYGNNNPYCQDNLISWLDWSLLEKNRALYEFFRYMIHFRKAHACIRKDLEPSYLGFPSMSLHGLTPWKPDLPESSHTACVLFSGYDDTLHKEDLVFLAVNTHWCSAALTLPQLRTAIPGRLPSIQETKNSRHSRILKYLLPVPPFCLENGLLLYL